MTASISTLPIWKKGATAAEWLEELAGLARESPHKWSRIAVVFEEFDDEGLAIKSRLHTFNHPHNTGIMGSLAVAQQELFLYMKGNT